MTNTRRYIGVFVGLVLCICSLQAEHIVGGEMTYECLGPGTQPGTRDYRFTMTVYRDCAANGAPFDDPATVGIYTVGASGLHTYFGDLDIGLGDVLLIDPSDENPCLIIPADVCVERTQYVWTINNLEVIDQDYRFEYRRCCRNQTINNIFNPGETGATFGVTITAEAQEVCNSSPTFDQFPPLVICVDEDIDFLHSAIDGDGDQLVYSFCAPISAGGTAGSGISGGLPQDCDGVSPSPINCAQPYPPVEFIVPTFTSTAPLAGNPVVDIDPITGLISGNPEIQGQFVVGVCVTEFRNGVELGSIQRDFQFNVTLCEPAVNASISADSVINTDLFVLNSCGERTIDFMNLSGNTAFIDTYEWNIDVDGTVETFSERDISFEFPEAGTYTGYMAVNPGTVCADTARLEINIFPGLEAGFDFDYDTCVAGEVQFMDQSITEGQAIEFWNWSFGDDSTSSLQNPAHLYETPGLKEISFTIRDENGCEEMLSDEILYQPAPEFVILDPSRFVGCAPGFIFFDNLSTPIDSTYTIRWDFGDGTTSDELSPRHFYDSVGIFDISVDITSPIGCTVSGFFPDYIEILQGPIAGFTIDPPSEIISILNPIVNFIDQSQDANSWQWRFGDDGVAFVQNPTYTFQDTGLQEIVQVVTNANSCTDTARLILDVSPVVNYFIPTAFTPNNDGDNDEFIGVGARDGFKFFRMFVMNRWGERVFETNDPAIGWNGLKFNTGRPSPQGVYAVQVEYIGPRGEVTRLESPLTLIR